MQTITETTSPQEPRSNNNYRKGFASFSPERRRELASRGGRAAHQLGTAHTWTSEEAQAAGRKGGAKSKRGPSQNSARIRAHLAKTGNVGKTARTLGLKYSTVYRYKRLVSLEAGEQETQSA